MPELPEVETVRRGLAPAMVGARITRVSLRRPNLRFLPERFVERLEGRRVLDLSRRAKYLIAALDSGESLILHLGMSGRFDVARPDGSNLSPGDFYLDGALGTPKHDHVVMAFETGATVTYNDARRFGFMDLVPTQNLERCRHLAQMGIEPLSEALDGAAIARLFRHKITPLKAALLDQRLIAGLGNIYVCEALHRAGLHPALPAGALAKPDGSPTPKAKKLARDIKAVLTEAVAAGGSTLRDYAHPDGQSGGFQHVFRVYDRTGFPCQARGCTGHVTRIVQGGRSTFFCEVCQVMPGS